MDDPVSVSVCRRDPQHATLMTAPCPQLCPSMALSVVFGCSWPEMRMGYKELQAPGKGSVFL